jgi:hypothetical protein
LKFVTKRRYADVSPYKLHLAVDAAVGAVFAAAPFIFGFEGLDAAFYWANGVAVLIVVSLHKPEPAAELKAV